MVDEASYLKAILPAFLKLNRASANAFLDVANECLSDTPVMLILRADGVQLVSRADAVATAHALYDVPTHCEKRGV